MPYKLTYFNGRGWGEMIRLMFAAAGVEYEDCRLTMEEFKKLKEGKHGEGIPKISYGQKRNYRDRDSGTLPFGQVPVLEVHGKMLSKSVSMLKFVARETGFSPKDSFQIAKADMIVDGIVDFMEKVANVWHEQDEELKKGLFKTILEKDFPVAQAQFEKLLKASGGKYFADNKLTYADILYYSSIEACLYKESKEGVPSALDGFPLLKDLYDRVANNPGIKEWVKKRPDTPL